MPHLQPAFQTLLISVIVFVVVACSASNDKLLGRWHDEQGNIIEIHKSLEQEYTLDVELNSYNDAVVLIADACNDKITFLNNSLSGDGKESAPKVRLIYNPDSDNLGLMLGESLNSEIFYRQAESQ